MYNKSKVSTDILLICLSVFLILNLQIKFCDPTWNLGVPVFFLLHHASQIIEKLKTKKIEKNN